MKNFAAIVIAFLLALTCAKTSAKSLHELQQNFVDLQFGLFVHFGMGTYLDNDWADPDAPLSLFNPTKLDCGQWLDAAGDAGMNFVCMAVKHHNGFCMWDSKVTPYNAANSACGRDVVAELAREARNRGMGLMFHFSILDLHQGIVHNHIQPYHKDFLKEQLRELLTGYGPVTALMIDGWDAPWSRISYDEIPFDEIYRFCKSIQPDCLVMDLNGAKYPAEALFYSDIKTYEQGAGQHIDKDSSFLPSMACYPMQETWFWKTNFPSTPVKSARSLVDDNLVPMNKVGCTFILNAAPNRDGLLDPNAVAELKKIGQIRKAGGKNTKIAQAPAPITASNLAKGCHATGSWSNDMNIHDFVTDDNYGSCWNSNPAVAEPWIAVELRGTQPVNAVAITAARGRALKNYVLEAHTAEGWQKVSEVDHTNTSRVNIHRFDRLYADSVRVRFARATGTPAIAEVGVYNEH